jgi:signal transduction histidine kinase/CheY-like chemotaxis protein
MTGDGTRAAALGVVGPTDDVRRLLRNVLDSAPIVLFALDSDGVVTLAEGRGLEMARKRSDSLVGGSVLERFAGQPEVLRDVRRALAGEEFTAEHVIDGAVLETTYRSLRDAEGRPNGTVGISVDVTARRRAEEERERIQTQLLQAQRLESLGVLSGGIAHDFNNLLAAILSNASLGLAASSGTGAANRAVREPLEQIVACSRRAAELTRQMLAYAGKARVEVAPLDLSEQVAEIGRLLASSLPKTVVLSLALAPDLPTVDADRAQVHQVVMNLVINGAEAIGERPGTVRIETFTQEVDEASARTLRLADRTGEVAPGRYVFLAVTDDGAGMDASTQAKIFDPFFTTKSAGRGLGLAAVLGIVRAHRGGLRITSTANVGTRFEIFFPASSRAPALALPPLRPSPSPARPTGVVLVVDDEWLLRSSAARILEQCGFHTLQAANGREAVEVFRRAPAAVHAVLLDMTMPELGGVETLRELRKFRADLPVVLTSGYDETEATQRFSARELAGFLPKPYSAEELTASIQRAISGWP